MRNVGLLFGSCVGLTMLTAMAWADPVQTTPTQAAPSTTQEDPNEVICKSMPPTTGTRLGASRECHTRHEWDDRTKQAQQMMMDSRMRGGTAIPGDN